ncbi:MAG TPA: hypothetical protein VL728_18605 [Cyclobacteriaceae bacterium]|jgi:hypothetical protein|nr:hypothetical protein [Cyclobacteriaceae bacterium]
MKAIALMLLGMLAIACANEVGTAKPCTVPSTVEYFTDVYPIIDRSCAIPACHVNGFQYGNFKNADDVKKAADNGKLEFMIVTRQMPAGFTKGPSYLTDCEISTITTWIKEGAPIK